MNTFVICILVCVISCWAGYIIGWLKAHHTIATECTVLGSFYVGNQVFKCTEVSVKE